MDVELTITNNDAAEMRIIVRSLPAILGRSEKADVPLRDPWASHKHCALSELNGTLVVRDLGSKNGIFLHGHRVTEASLLPGDRLTIGRTEITVHYQRMAQTAAESGSQPPNRGTSPSSDPETRELPYGVAGDTAKPRTPSADEEESPMTDNDAFEAGIDAYWDGVDLEDNPHSQEKNTEFESWIKGWREAQKHDYDEGKGRG